MALKKNFQYNGVQVAGGYLKVANINGDKNRLAFVLSYSFDADHNPLKTEQLNFVPNMDGGNFIAQSYEYLKTLDGFQDALDC